MIIEIGSFKVDKKVFAFIRLDDTNSPFESLYLCNDDEIRKWDPSLDLEPDVYKPKNIRTFDSIELAMEYSEEFKIKNAELFI
jgi:hypothetical protein